MTADPLRCAQARASGVRDLAEGALRRLARGPGGPPDPSPPWGVNLFGYYRTGIGLGESARGMLAAMERGGVPVVAVDVRAAPGVRRDTGLATVSPAEARYAANVFHLNADGLKGVVRRHGRATVAGRWSTAMWWWEVDPVPAGWSEVSRLLDQVWVGSDHVLGLLAPALPVPVRKIHQAVPLPRPSAAGRAELRLPPGFLFLSSFDFASSMARKNPVGLVRAFQRAFPTAGEAQLVIRSINARRHPSARRVLARAASGRRDIHLRDGYLSPGDKDATLAHCNCYVSLHRAEGFGLALAEAMRLGKPAIATRWSGNLEFMRDSNSYLVDCTPSHVGPGAYPYPPTSLWAEPHEGRAAELMRHVFDHREEAVARGRRAAEDLARGHDPSVVGPVLRRALLAAER